MNGLAVALKPFASSPSFSTLNRPRQQAFTKHPTHSTRNVHYFRVRYRGTIIGDDDAYSDEPSFDEAVSLFNQREYYKCHDSLESLWNSAEEPSRTLLHGILQCAVGFHHLFNQNHRGAMMELGEGVCKLRKMEFESGDLCEFEKEVSAVLDFIYQTQIELAACIDDLCLAMDGSERSYQLLGGYGAGQHLYGLESEADDDDGGKLYIVFYPQPSSTSLPLRLRVKLPVLMATAQDLMPYT